MSEYIVTCDEEKASWIGNDVDSMKPVVRCRDCVKCEENKAFGGLSCHRFSMWDSAGFPVEPNGFCAWGERRD